MHVLFGVVSRPIFYVHACIRAVWIGCPAATGRSKVGFCRNHCLCQDWLKYTVINIWPHAIVVYHTRVEPLWDIFTHSTDRQRCTCITLLLLPSSRPLAASLTISQQQCQDVRPLYHKFRRLVLSCVVAKSTGFNSLHGTIFQHLLQMYCKKVYNC